MNTQKLCHSSLDWQALGFKSQLDLQMVLFLSPSVYGENYVKAISPQHGEFMLFDQYAKECLLIWTASQAQATEKEKSLDRQGKFSSVVYFVSDDLGQAIKIGTAKNANTRLAELQCGSSSKLRILKVVKGDRKHEAKLHQKFKHLRMHGEWFKAAPELIKFIESL